MGAAPTLSAGQRLRVTYSWPRGYSAETAAKELGVSMARLAPFGMSGAVANALPHATLAGTVVADLLITLRTATAESTLLAAARRPGAVPVTAAVSISRTATDQRETAIAIAVRETASNPTGTVTGLTRDAASTVQDAAEAIGDVAEYGFKKILVPLCIIAGCVALVVYAPAIKAGLK